MEFSIKIESDGAKAESGILPECCRNCPSRGERERTNGMSDPCAFCAMPATDPTNPNRVTM